MSANTQSIKLIRRILFHHADVWIHKQT